MTTAEAVSAYIAAAERHERLRWALKARRALDKRVRYWKRGGYVDGACPSTLPGVPGREPMGEWERSQLERQLAVAPTVTTADVRAASAHAAELKRNMKATRRQERLELKAERMAVAA